MIKKREILPVILLMGSLLMGCTSSTDRSELEDGAPIAFGTIMTRSAVDADKAGMESFLVWGGFDGQNNLFNAETVTPSGAYTGTRYWVSGKRHNFYALHPAGLDKTNVECTDGVITVGNFDTSETGPNAIDLMTASATNLEYSVGQQPGKVSLSFSHALSRVKFTISTEAKVTISDICLTGIAYKGDYTMKADAASSWSNLKQATETETAPFKQPGSIELAVNGSSDLLGGDLLLIPQRLTDKMIFYMTWTYENGEQKIVRISLPNAGVDIWEAGKSYQYAATIPPYDTDVKLTVKVSDWNNKRIDADL